MAKDPAALIYIDKWVSSTNGMKAEFRAWYFDLLICIHRKGYIPEGIEEMYTVCGVREDEKKSFIEMLITLNIPSGILEKYTIQEGTHHWNWKGGISSENIRQRNSPEYINWRRNVFLRDKYTCRNCGQKGGRLEAHHVKSFSEHPSLRTDVSNGITLCKKCHNKEHQIVK